MNALSLHSKILDGYKDYIESFIDIRDDDIRSKVEESLQTRKELLTRLLKLNHQRAAEEAANAPVKATKTRKPQRAKKEDEML